MIHSLACVGRIKQQYIQYFNEQSFGGNHADYMAKVKAIAEAVDAYFLELRKNWSETSQTIVRVSQIENRILGVDGVVDVTGTKLNGTASNMTLTEFCIPKLGGVSA